MQNKISHSDTGFSTIKSVGERAARIMEITTATGNENVKKIKSKRAIARRKRILGELAIIEKKMKKFDGIMIEQSIDNYIRRRCKVAVEYYRLLYGEYPF